MPVKKKTKRVAKKKVTAKKKVAKNVTKKSAVRKKTVAKKKVAKKSSRKKKVAKKKTAKKSSRKKKVAKKKTAKKSVLKKKKVAKKKIAKKSVLKMKKVAKKAALKKKATFKKKITKGKIKKKPMGKVTSIKKTSTKKSKKTVTPSKKKVSSKDYMGTEQTEYFRQILLAWKIELMEEVDRTVHHMQDDASNFPDPNDRASQEEEFALELRTRDRERKLISKINESIATLDSGDYGHCEICGIEIGVKRLEARPTATLCIDCKTLDEIKEHHLG